MRAERLDELERIIGLRPIVASVWSQAPQTIVEEAQRFNASIIVFDVPGQIAVEVAYVSRQRKIAVVVVPHLYKRTEQYGRGTSFAFRGYEMVDEEGVMTRLGDGALAQEIELLKS